MNATPIAIRVSKLVSVLLVLALLATALPQPALAQTCSRSYTVVAGDTASKIAETYKITVQELATANNLTEPYTIFVGQVLCIPGTATTTTTTTTGSTSTSTSPSLSVWIVGNKIVIEASNYPKNSTYYVRAGERDFKHGQWLKLGRARARKDGSLDATFLFPKALRNSRVVVVCLKNIVDDALACQRIRQ